MKILTQTSLRHTAGVTQYNAHSRLASRSADAEATLNHKAFHCGNDTAISNTTGVCNPDTGRRFLSKMLLPLTIFLIMIATTNNTTAQPTITFYPSDGKTLTQEDVTNTLTANGLTRESEFHAIIEIATHLEYDPESTHSNHTHKGAFYSC